MVSRTNFQTSENLLSCGKIDLLLGKVYENKTYAIFLQIDYWFYFDSLRDQCICRPQQSKMQHP